MAIFDKFWCHRVSKMAVEVGAKLDIKQFDLLC